MIILLGNGVWLSLVECLTGGQEVAGSNPVTPTMRKVEPIDNVYWFFFCVLVVLRVKKEPQGLHYAKRLLMFFERFSSFSSI